MIVRKIAAGLLFVIGVGIPIAMLGFWFLGLTGTIVHSKDDENELPSYLILRLLSLLGALVVLVAGGPWWAAIAATGVLYVYFRLVHQYRDHLANWRIFRRD